MQSVLIDNIQSPSSPPDFDNVISLDEFKDKKYNPQAAYYALPKAFISRLLCQMSGSTLKVFLALVYHTNCFNIILYPDKITHKWLMNITGIKNKETISKAYKDLESLNIIGGYKPGHGSDNTKFYFTFDINHYRTEECCLELEEISSYYEMLLLNKGLSDHTQLKNNASSPEAPDNSPADLPDDAANCGNPVDDTSDNTLPDIDDYVNEPHSTESQDNTAEPELNYITTVKNGWGRAIKLYQKDDDPDNFLLDDGSLFCSKEELLKCFPGVAEKLNLYNSIPLPKNVDNEDIKSGEQSTKNRVGEGVPKNSTPSPEKSAQGRADNPYSLNTINFSIFNNLIVLAKKDSNFIHEFNDFCIEDSPKYIKNTLYWVIKNACDYNLSIDEVIASLEIANNKNMRGKFNYLIGIMKNKANNKTLGIGAINKPIPVQVNEYFNERFKHCIEFLKFYKFDWDSMTMLYSLKDSEISADKRQSQKDFLAYVTCDIEKHLGFSFKVVECE